MLASERKSKLRFITYSDVHLGLPRVSMQNEVDALYKITPNADSMSDVDIIFIAGDFFDRSLNLTHPDLNIIMQYIHHLLSVCAKYDIILRVLEGTPSHDCKQSKLFIDLNEIHEIGCDVRWVTQHSIEYIDQHDCHVLYVPDEVDHDPMDTWLRTVSMMEQWGIDQVDISCMHGAFEFQFPEILKMVTHDSSKYSGITRHYITIGHHHTQRHKDNILVQGSLGRGKHGEEGAKGHYDVTIKPDGRDSVVFVENTLATIFKHVDCTGMVLQDALNLIDATVESVPQNSHIRIGCESGGDLALSFQRIKFKHEDVFWSIKTEKMNSGDQFDPGRHVLNSTIETDYRTLDISPTTVRRIMQDRLAKHSKVETIVGLLDKIR